MAVDRNTRCKKCKWGLGILSTRGEIVKCARETIENNIDVFYLARCIIQMHHTANRQRYENAIWLKGRGESKRERGGGGRKVGKRLPHLSRA